MKTPATTPTPTRGFTLIELLTVIAIIGILAAIIIPTVGKVRTLAREQIGLSNVREVVKASLLFANDNKGYGPNDKIRQDQGLSTIAELVYPYISGSVSNRGEVLADPSTQARDANNKPPSQFSFNPWFTNDVANGYAAQPANRLLNIKAPSRLIYLADGVLITQGGQNQASNQFWQREGIGADGNTFIGTTNLLEGSNYGGAPAGDIAYRSKDKTSAKVGYADGHVSFVQKGTITNSNINPAFNN